jgi:hypothetical protein
MNDYVSTHIIEQIEKEINKKLGLYLTVEME